MGAAFSGGTTAGFGARRGRSLLADDQNQPAMEAEGSAQFSYPGKDGEIMTLGYWSLPDSAADDRDEAVRWARRAIEASRRKVGPKKKKPYKGSGR